MKKWIVFVLFSMVIIYFLISYFDNRYPAEVPLLSPLKSPYKVKASNDEILIKILDKTIYENFNKIDQKNINVNLSDEPEAPVNLNSQSGYDVFENASKLTQESDLNQKQMNILQNKTDSISVWDVASSDISGKNYEKNLQVTTVSDKKALKQLAKKETIKYYSLLGYYRSSTEASKSWIGIKSLNKKLLNSIEHKIIKAKKDNGIYYELLIGPYEDFKDAKSMCKKIVLKNQKCIVNKK